MSPDRYEVTVTDAAVVIRRSGSSIPSVANILGSTVGPDGTRTIWLDRRIHTGASVELTPEWTAHGAVSTVLVGR